MVIINSWIGMRSDFRRYSGSGSEEDELKLFYERIRKILTRLEKYI